MSTLAEHVADAVDILKWDQHHVEAEAIETMRKDNERLRAANELLTAQGTDLRMQLNAVRARLEVKLDP